MLVKTITTKYFVMLIRN